MVLYWGLDLKIIKIFSGAGAVFKGEMSKQKLQEEIFENRGFSWLHQVFPNPMGVDKRTFEKLDIFDMHSL